MQNYETYPDSHQATFASAPQRKFLFRNAQLVYAEHFPERLNFYH